VNEGLAATGPGDRGTTAMLYLCMEVAGCPTVCQHCWAQGTGYGMMPLAEIEWVLEEAHRFCDGRRVGFDAYPMHELAAHPDAARLFGLFNSHSATVKGPGGTMFEPLTTTGVPLAIRHDWQAVLRAAADTGTLNIWTAFHGVGEVHDRQVNRRGAFAETCRGVERARAAGVSVGCNVFLTTASLPQLDELATALPPLGVHAMSIETASFLPTPRSRRNEPLRPTLADLLPAAARIAELTVLPDRWASLETRTEAAWVRQALAGDWPGVPDRAPGELALVCRPNLDVYSGLAGLYRTRHGNLRADGVAAVLGRALAQGHQPDDELWFGPGPLPAPGELAARYGDAAGLGVHLWPESVRYLWLDRAQREAGKDRPQRGRELLPG
jgi:sulfatase maturation enzyme AslB (radical SAM superfamily)